MKNIFSIIIVSMFFSACGLSPQIVKINPVLNEAKVTSANTTFNILVTDKRNSQVLGLRGGVYKDTSTVKTEGDITANIQFNLAEAFEKAGYTVSPSATTKLEVSIIRLEYQGHGENRVSEVDVSAEILATVTNSVTKFTKSYKASRKKEVLKAPDENKNEVMINEILGSVIQRVLDDEELLSYIK